MSTFWRKLTSRKLWMANAGVATGIALALGADSSEIQTITGAVTALVSAVAYIVTEGKGGCGKRKKRRGERTGCRGRHCRGGNGMKILLIAGHGAGDPGACGCGYKEADLTREVVGLLKTRLSKYADVTVYDTTKNAFAVLNKGGSINFKPYDYVLEVHFNAFDGTAKGTEIYVTAAEKGTTVERDTLEKVCAMGFTKRGVKTKDFLVIRTAKNQGVSSALLEVCFIDSKTDMAIYKAKKTQIADAIVAGIVEGFGLKKTSSTEPDYRTMLQKRSGVGDAAMDHLASYKYGDDLIRKLATMK